MGPDLEPKRSFLARRGAAPGLGDEQPRLPPNHSWRGPIKGVVLGEVEPVTKYRELIEVRVESATCRGVLPLIGQERSLKPSGHGAGR